MEVHYRVKAVIDSNILFSALIRDSTTRRLILEYDDQFLFPSFIFEEMEKHKTELLEKSEMTSEEFNRLLQLFLMKVIIVPKEMLIQHKEEAFAIVKDIDPDDATFVACALAYPGSIILSDDKRLKLQTRVKIINTREFIELQKKQKHLYMC